MIDGSQLAKITLKGESIEWNSINEESLCCERFSLVCVLSKDGQPMGGFIGSAHSGIGIDASNFLERTLKSKF